MKFLLQGLTICCLMTVASLAHAETSVCFSPNGSCLAAVVTEINKARHSIDAAMYSFTSKDIAQALLKAKERNVKIRISLDRAQINDHTSKSRFLINNGLNVKFHLGPGLLHDKFAVIDDREVLTGSFNWTVNADKKNAENLLVIKDKELARQYTKQFGHIWSQSGEGGLRAAQGEQKE